MIPPHRRDVRFTPQKLDEVMLVPNRQVVPPLASILTMYYKRNAGHKVPGKQHRLFKLFLLDLLAIPEVTEFRHRFLCRLAAENGLPSPKEECASVRLHLLAHLSSVGDQGVVDRRMHGCEGRHEVAVLHHAGS